MNLLSVVPRVPPEYLDASSTSAVLPSSTSPSEKAAVYIIIVKSRTRFRVVIIHSCFYDRTAQRRGALCTKRGFIHRLKRANAHKERLDAWVKTSISYCLFREGVCLLKASIMM